MKLISSCLRWPGGKHRAIPQILAKLPKDIIEWREPCLGGGNIFLAAIQNNIAKSYWVNDLYSELINFWKVVSDQHATNLMQEWLRYYCSFSVSVKKDQFNLFQKTHWNDTINEEVRHSALDAIRFFFINRCSFSGSTMSGGFSASAAVDRFTYSSIDRIALCTKYFSQAKITNLDYSALIDEPGAGVFLMLDPPYSNARKLYGVRGNLHEFPHTELAERLKSTKHKFLITYGDIPEIGDLYSWANIEPFTIKYGMSKKKTGAEVFISNY